MTTSRFYPLLRLDALNSFVVLAIALFSALTIIYSLKFIKEKRLQYYTYIILTAFASIGVVLANNLILLLVFWGFLGLTLYLLVSMGQGSTDAAKKTLIIVGGSDALMLLGVAIIYFLTDTFYLDAIRLEFNSSLAVISYICIALACFAKAGAIPLHTWIPDAAKSAPAPVAAFLPASLDKLLGIYLLARLNLDLFTMNTAMNTFLMVIGAVTIITAVMMALVQHNLKRLLGYHAVSQVGYMVLGIGTGNPIGIAGGIFHMLNHAVYKSCLFFTAGNIEYRAKTSELDELGGLAKLMPVTYISCLVASFSISGVPPFNGFFSKWMIYQGLVTQLQSADYRIQAINILCLAAAMFGSGLTLASFMKLIHAAFLGQPNNALIRRSLQGGHKDEVPFSMWLPPLILAVICVVFGVFAYQIPLRVFIFPAVPGVDFIGTWFAGLSTLLIASGLVLGLFIFRSRGLGSFIRQDAAFMGCEPEDLDKHRITGIEFYNTIKEYGILKGIYQKAESGVYDIYEQVKKVLSGAGRFLQYLHNGVLPSYLIWALLGMIGLFLILMKG
ncbi:MAG: proton-conducting transporter membrane subunit [Candidatus Omnitrophica bacterium]|nr:proton-conducting transporter membrane subunit [Candidatus Omnitrophota bacterium]MDD5609987.1 proton-conducting transporter membrane subunit [Candidatus Omnitrophota bacterium]